MDYGHPEHDFSGRMVVSPLDSAALKRAMEAYEMYNSVWNYPHNYLSDIQGALRVLEATRPAVLTVEVEHDREGVDVERGSVQI